jgi:hypothetical protein
MFFICCGSCCNCCLSRIPCPCPSGVIPIVVLDCHIFCCHFRNWSNRCYICVSLIPCSCGTDASVLFVVFIRSNNPVAPASSECSDVGVAYVLLLFCSCWCVCKAKYG